MKLYRLEFILREPSEDTEQMYLAEVPALPGCRAWGKTAPLALQHLQGVTTAFIESHHAHGDELPPEVAAAAVEVGERSSGQVLVAV